MKLRYLITGIILTTVLIAGIIFLKKSRPAIVNATSVVSSENKSKGPSAAKVQIIEFSDFECPACRMAIPIIEEILKTYPGQIRFSYQHFPLSSHHFSPLAHQAAECAAMANKFWEYHDRLYQEQLVWTSSLTDPTETFLLYARDLGLNLDAFAQCLGDENVRRRILIEKANGDLLRVSSTPTFFINGERVVGGVDLKIKGEARIREILGLKAEK